MSQPPTRPVGINLTEELVSRTAQLETVMQEKVTGRRAEEVWNFATAFIPIAWEEATSRYKTDGKPGLILAGRTL